jgi:hypothetical protein
VTLADLAILFKPFGFIAPNKYLALQSFDCKRSWFHKRVVRTKLDIYVFITISGEVSPRVCFLPNVNVSTLTWFMRYIYYGNLLPPNGELDIKINTYMIVAELGYLV